MAPKNSYYQYFECDGYQAKVTIEWQVPNKANPDYLKCAENLADQILIYSAPKTRDMVQAMRHGKM